MAPDQREIALKNARKKGAALSRSGRKAGNEGAQEEGTGGRTLSSTTKKKKKMKTDRATISGEQPCSAVRTSSNLKKKKTGKSRKKKSRGRRKAASSRQRRSADRGSKSRECRTQGGRTALPKGLPPCQEELKGRELGLMQTEGERLSLKERGGGKRDKRKMHDFARGKNTWPVLEREMSPHPER